MDAKENIRPSLQDTFQRTTARLIMNEVIASRATMFRKPVRISITLPHSTYMELERKSDEQGRSLSNLAAYLIEGSLRQPTP